MSESIETTGTDVEAAVARALSELGVARADVRVDILEEPGRRLLGLGTRQARVRVTVMKRDGSSVIPAASPSIPPAAAPVAKPIPPAPSAEPLKAAIHPAPAKAEKPAERTAERPRPGESAPSFEDDEDEGGAPKTAEQLDHEAEAGAEALRQLLQHMHLDAQVIVKRAETDGNEEPHWMLEILGQDLGGLIGHRGETLAALQYITRLIASRGLERRANIVIDVEGYKSRRETMLRRLAKRMADQAIERGRTVSLEPMPPHERRIIHLALRDNPSVTTESIGDGDKRKVTIIPRRAR